MLLYSISQQILVNWIRIGCTIVLLTSCWAAPAVAWLILDRAQRCLALLCLDAILETCMALVFPISIFVSVFIGGVSGIDEVRTSVSYVALASREMELSSVTGWMPMLTQMFSSLGLVLTIENIKQIKSEVKAANVVPANQAVPPSTRQSTRMPITKFRLFRWRLMALAS